MNHSDEKEFSPVFTRTGRWIISFLGVFLVLTMCIVATGADKTDSPVKTAKSDSPTRTGKTGKTARVKKTRHPKAASAKIPNHSTEPAEGTAAPEHNAHENPASPHAPHPEPEATPPVPVAIPHGTVPNFSSPHTPSYSTQSENEFYQQMLDRRDDTLAPNAPAKLRFYSDYIMNKYDKNKDGLLQESEWKTLPGAQGIDVNGDFVLSSDEILYYLVRYSQKRTIFYPEVSIAESRRHEVSTQGAIKLQPLSAKTKPVTKSEAKRTKTDKELADYNQEQVKKMLSDAEAAVKENESDDDLEAAEKMLESVKPSQVREYAVSAVEIQGMPRWFILRDTNGDGQLSLREFAPGLDVESVAFFGKLDLNADGLVTPDELRSYIAPQK